MGKLRFVGGCFLLVAGLVWSLQGAAQAQGGKLVVILLENETYDNIVANSQAPYLNQLISEGSLFTNYTAQASGSNANYLAMTSGLTSELSPPSPNIFQAIDSSGSATWKEFMESMAGNCASGISTDVPGTSVPLYTASHDADYQYRANTTCGTNDVPMTTNTFDPASLPDLSVVVPNQCDDMHTLPGTNQACPAYFGSNSGTSVISMSDNWLATVVPPLLAQPNVTVLITWDEGALSTTPPEHVATLEVGAGVTAGSQDGTAYTHYSLEAGLYGYFGLGTAPNNGATATPLPIFGPGPGPGPGPAPAPVPTVTGVSPDAGPTTGRSSVTITGTDLTGANAVSFGAAEATTFTVNSATQITATVPPGSVGTVPVTVTTAGGTSATGNADDFTYTARPTTGYWMVGSDGGVFAFGNAGFVGSLPGLGVHVDDIVGVVPTPTGKGYWMVGSDGGVFAFGDAGFLGSLPRLNVHVSNIVGVVPTFDDKGYWMVGSDGGVFAFGDARFVGSLPGIRVHLNDIVAVVPTHDGRGYWMVGSDGGVFAFGDAGFLGSLPRLNVHVNDIVGVVPTADTRGYWMVGSDGGVFAFGDARFVGSLPKIGVHVTNIVGVVPTSDSAGYWMVGSGGGVFAFGDAGYLGSLPGLGVHADDIVAVVPS